MLTSTSNVIYGEITMFLNLHNVYENHYIFINSFEKYLITIHVNSQFFKNISPNFWADTIFCRIIKTYLQTDGQTDSQTDELIWGGLIIHSLRVAPTTHPKRRASHLGVQDLRKRLYFLC